MRISDWSSDVCSSDLLAQMVAAHLLDRPCDHEQAGHHPHQYGDADHPAQPDMPAGELLHDCPACHQRWSAFTILSIAAAAAIQSKSLHSGPITCIPQGSPPDCPIGSTVAGRLGKVASTAQASPADTVISRPPMLSMPRKTGPSAVGTAHTRAGGGSA